jgi:phosphatidylglycerol---prolipoprotein diacylglyceryl transferase
MDTISFPGLGLHFTINQVAIPIPGHPIAWYGIIIAVGLLLALIYGMKRAKSFNITIDDLSDVVIFSIIFAIIGARLYYVFFDPERINGANPYFTDPISILYIWNGGLAIYGGIIAAFITAFVVCKVKKISVGAMFDIAALGFLIGQAIGRWGNFVNQEAYGSATKLPWGMVISSEPNPVHPCFLYESLWCILGFIILHIYSKRRKFNGEVFLMYIMWYAFGRFFIEGLRTDSLMLGNLKVSQLVAAVLFIVAGSLLVYKRRSVKKLAVEQAEDYKPLFEDTSKAVEEDTSGEAEEIPEEKSAEPEEKKVEAPEIEKKDTEQTVVEVNDDSTTDEKSEDKKSENTGDVD